MSIVHYMSVLNSMILYVCIISCCRRDEKCIWNFGQKTWREETTQKN